MLNLNQEQAYRDKMEAQLLEWSARIDLLKAKASKASAEARLDALALVDSLKAKREAASSRLHELGRSTEEAFEDTKVGVERAFSELKFAIAEAVDRFRD